MSSFDYHSSKNSTSKIYYSDTGKGPAVLFIHGYLEDSQMWDKLKTSWPHRSICIDLPGHGRSESSPDCVTISNLAEICFQLMRNLEIQSFHIVGHSMGGYIGLEMINQHKRAIRSIFLFHSTATADTAEKKVIRTRTIKIIEANKRVYTSETLKKLFSMDFEDFDIISNQIKKASKTQISAMISCTKAMRDRDEHLETLKTFEGKIGYYIGKNDQVLDHKNISKETERVGANQIYLDEKSGHMSHVEAPKMSSEAFQDWFTHL